MRPRSIDGCTATSYVVGRARVTASLGNRPDLPTTGVVGHDSENRSEQLPVGARSLLETLASVLSVVEDYLFAWVLLPNGMVVTNFESRPIGAFLGLEAADTPPLDVLRERTAFEDQALFDELERSLTTGEAEIETSLHVEVGDGSRHIVIVRAACSVLDDGTVCVEGILKDVGSPEAREDEMTDTLAMVSSQQAELEMILIEVEQLKNAAEQRSRIDALTGAYNRRHFIEGLGVECARSGREGKSVGLMILDIDKFKNVNDTYGHPAGDAVLIEAADRLQGAIRKSDLLARFGGEEFVVLMPAVADDATLLRLADRVRRALGNGPIILADGTPLLVTASAGASRWSRGVAEEALLDAADRALYAAKRGGRDQTRLFSSLTEEDLAAEEPEVIKLARGLALAVSVREASPERHCEEVAELAATIASRLSLGDAMVMRCRLGGWLHDVGTLAIPDRVLGGGTSLSDDDRAVLRAHVEHGADIVGRMTALREAVGSVRHHHERWDGTGYPDGLAGEAIPIDARIVAAADAYSAIRAGRAYQPALGPDDAVAQLWLSAGKSLDRDVVEALAAVIAAGEPLRTAA